MRGSQAEESFPRDFKKMLPEFVGTQRLPFDPKKLLPLDAKFAVRLIGFVELAAGQHQLCVTGNARIRTGEQKEAAEQCTTVNVQGNKEAV
jgi:hypothetical protein